MITKVKKQSRKDPSYLFLDRELSWLKFNARVLSLASDRSFPLLERLNFLSIFSSNLDEFYMKRVGAVKRLIAADRVRISTDGRTPREEIEVIRAEIVARQCQAESIFFKEIQPEMQRAGIELVRWNELSKPEARFATRFFRSQIFPLLTPLSVDAGHPFPLISNLATSLGVLLSPPGRDDRLFARVKLSGIDPQWLLLEGKKRRSKYRFLSLREMVLHNLSGLFPEMEIIASMPFRITRNADLDVDDEEAEDVRELIEEELRQRRFAQVIRLEHEMDPDPWILGFLMEELNLNREDVFQRKGELDYTGFRDITRLPIPELKFPVWAPLVPMQLLDESSMFNAIRHRDILVHHPYESFSASVEAFLREAARDPRVLSIKMTVYRVGEQAPLIPLLIEAAANGKQVVCFVELKARFEEALNLRWTQQLEHEGVHVAYGIPGLKIHSKMLLVVRRELEGVRCYAHFGTGNYNPNTAELYTDLGLFTCKAEYTTEMLDLFNFLTGRSLKEDYDRILVAPINMESRFIKLIRREIRNRKAGRPARIIAKMNSLEDEHLIRELYRASKKGVRVDLIIRGICCLRPGVPGLSENIQVISVVGRFLEHSRAFFFQNGKDDPADGEFFIGSADWMGRNLHRRVEAIVPLQDPEHRNRILHLLNIILADRKQAWLMKSDGSYQRRWSRAPGENRTNTHERLMRETREYLEKHHSHPIRAEPIRQAVGIERASG